MTREEARRMFDPSGIKCGDQVATQKLMRIELLLRDTVCEFYDLFPDVDKRAGFILAFRDLLDSTRKMFSNPGLDEFLKEPPKPVVRLRKNARK